MGLARDRRPRAATCPTCGIVVGARYPHQQRAAHAARRRRRSSRPASCPAPCAGSSAATSSATTSVVGRPRHDRRRRQQRQSIAELPADHAPARPRRADGHAGRRDARPHRALAPRDRARRRLHVRHRDAARRHAAPHVRPRHRAPPTPSRPNAWCRPPTRSTTTSTPSPTPPPPAAAAPIKIAFDSARHEEREPDASSRIRPRGRPLDTRRPVLARRGLQPREAAGRPQPGDLRRPSRSTPLDDIDGAIRHALLNPIDQDPLPALLFPGMKLTIAFDDISLPLPQMRRPDVRQRVIEAVLDLAADAGVDDVHIICALALHRRMTEAELRHAARRPRLRRVRAARPALPARRRGPRQPRLPRHDAGGRGGRDQQAGRRARPARLRQHQPRRDGRRVEVDGHRPRQLPQPAPPPQPARRWSAATASWTSTSSELHKSNWRMGKVLVRRRRQGLPDRDDAQHRHVPEAVRASCPSASGSGTPRDRATLRRHREVARRARRPRLARKIFHGIEAPHQMTSVQAGEVEAVHKVTTENVYGQQLVEVAGPDRHPDDGHPLHLPVQRQLDHEPDPRDVHRASATSSTCTAASRSCARAAW